MQEHDSHPSSGMPWPFPVPAAGFLEADPQAIVCYDPDLRVCWANPAAGELMAQPPETLVGRSLFCPGGALECPEAHECPVTRARSTGRRQEGLCRLEGGRLLRVRAEPVLDAENRLRGVVAYAQIATSSATADEPEEHGSSDGLRQALDAVHQALFVLDAATIAIVDVNETACRMFGCSRAELRNTAVDALSSGEPPCTLAHGMEHLDRARRTGPQLTEWRARARDGRLFWAEVSVSFSPRPGAGRFYVVARDISERKAAEQQLRASESTFRGLIEAISEAVSVQDAEGRFIVVNAGFERLYGQPREALLGRTPADLAAPGRNDMAALNRSFGRALSGERQTFEFWATRADGSQFLKEVLLSPGTYFGRPVIIALLRDITERRQEQEQRERDAHALHESAERFRQLLAHVPTVAVQGYAPDGTVRYWNEASERLYGYTASEALGRNLFDLIIPPAMRDEVRANVQGMGASGQPAPASELKLMRKDGSLVTVFSSHAVVRIPGTPTELYCLDIDLTERNRAENERLEMARGLHQKQKLESLGVLAGGIAHDFNNLLTAILGNLDLIRRDVPPHAASQTCLEDAMRAARNAAELTRQVLAYSGRSRTALKVMDLATWLASQVPSIRGAVPTHVILEVSPTAGLPPIKADPAQLAQIITNLVTNSVEAFGETAGRIVVRTSAVELSEARLAESRVEPRPPPGRFIVLEIADNAGGIDDAALQRVFEPFFTTKFVGRGLGMPVVVGLARAHHGAVFVQSEVGQGTTVQICFPVPDPDVPVPAQAPKPAATTLVRVSRGVLLIIDDEEPIRRLTARMGERLGFEVASAADADAGVARFRELSPRVACVMVDLSMPKKDGVACTHGILGIRSDARVVLTSGFPVEEMSARYAADGFAAFMQKPFTLAQFSEVLDQTTGSSKP